MINLHGKSDAFAEQELYASLTAFNFANRVCREVVVRQPKEGIYAYKVNFKMAVALCKEYIRTPNADGEKLMENIARYTVPIRPGRQDQRDLRVKGFPGLYAFTSFDAYISVLRTDNFSNFYFSTDRDILLRTRKAHWPLDAKQQILPACNSFSLLQSLYGLS